MKNDSSNETVVLKGFEPLRDSTPPHMVQIPLEEYRRYIEAALKGPTVEIPLNEYDRLREMELRQQDHIYRLEFDNQELKEEINRRADIKEQIEQATKRIITELKVTDSDTRNGGK